MGAPHEWREVFYDENDPQKVADAMSAIAALVRAGWDLERVVLAGGGQRVYVFRRQ
jgi:hypothetical protein